MLFGARGGIQWLSFTGFIYYDIMTKCNRKVSIIIPLHNLCDRFKKDFAHFLNLDYPDYEIISVYDNRISFQHERVISITTKKENTSPAEKRDLAIKAARGEICAFIDDDAYPDKDWVKNAVKYFDDEKVGAVGGPGLTPPEDKFLMKAGGLCYESFLGSGPNRYRFVKGKSRIVDDFPAYNLFVRKSVLDQIGGFGSPFYGGEDTKLCGEIVKFNKNIVYRPDVIVYHHRRPLFRAHLRQIGNVGLHRGYFVKKYPKTSRKLAYFLPTFFAIYFFISMLLFISLKVALIFIIPVIPMVLFFIFSFADCLRLSKSVSMAFVAVCGISLMHIVYGISFVKGLLTKDLKV
ncbi:MAG: hypothetical protein COS99_07055 [Candidatus Omnitrophica bacterium CG07_land_8_20_14_0_80_42_15]|uniref:Glycosyltransferase 2-like domain-containing protein n=1 Tax=Candidatus Aquitaenariimonas noxiae TaxID=1974741 RepID=A0A2J0KTH7_9BACT|nr:MAG: hypothetical protein COS99_07055 [Candidatus Omnitrophica bacterium CG07_land_8_20_14_0_80_42_15]